MDFSTLVKVRQSDRRYKPQAVEADKIDLCIEAARLAPSACNSQPWRFIVVDDAALRAEIADAAASMGMNGFVREAPVIVAVVLEKMSLTAAIGSVIRDKEFSLLDVGIAVSHFTLQAADLGLGTCIIGWFNERRVRKALGIPRGKRIPLLITLGYHDGPTRRKSRKTTAQMSSRNRY